MKTQIKFLPTVMLVTLFLSFLPLLAGAAEQQLFDLAYAGHRDDDGTIVIDTSGAAKLRISFLTPTMARVQVFPTGIFTTNPSPAVAAPMAPLKNIKVLDHTGVLVIKSAGLSLHINKSHLRIDAYDADDRNPLSLENPDAGTTWDKAAGTISQSRLLDDTEHIYGLGEDNINHGTLDRRGTLRDMWTGQQINSGNVTANYPVPFYLSSGRDGRGYGIFVDNVWHLRFDIGKSQNNLLTWTSPGGPIDYYIING